MKDISVSKSIIKRIKKVFLEHKSRDLKFQKMKLLVLKNTMRTNRKLKQKRKKTETL